MRGRRAQIVKCGIAMGKDDWRRGCAVPAKSGLLPEWDIAARSRHQSDPVTNQAMILMSKADNGALYNIIDDLRDGIATLVAERDAAVRLAAQRAGELDELRQRNLRALKLLGGLWQDVAMGLGTADEWYATMRLAVEEAVTGNLAAALRAPSGQQDATEEPS